MRRMILIGMVLGLFLSLAGGTLAASSASAPKALCLLMVQWGDSLVLSNKMSGSVKTADGPVKFYAIHGEQYYAGQNYSLPVSGTGHVKNGVFHFSLTGSGIGPTSYLWTYFIEGKWNLTTTPSTGTYTWHRISSDGTATIREGDLSQEDCATCSLPY
jgi:hypothetical protein